MKLPQEQQCKCMGECSSKTRTMSRLLGYPEHTRKSLTYSIRCQGSTSEGQDGYCYSCFVSPVRE